MLYKTRYQNLLDLIEQCHGSRSTIISSQIQSASGMDLLARVPFADAILGRWLFTHRIDLKRDSLIFNFAFKNRLCQVSFLP
ncbi:MAG: hypothetical protein WD267_05480 [Balneolales bacterium]